MTKHLVLNGFVAPFPAADAAEDFVELDEEMSAIVRDAFAEGFVLGEDLSSLHDAAEAAQEMANARSPYLEDRDERARKAKLEKPSIRDRLNAAAKDNSGNNDRSKNVDA